MKNGLEKLHADFTACLSVIFESLALENLDEILENTEEDAFSELWTEAYSEVKNNHAGDDIKASMDRVRKKVFMLTYQKTNSSDLSAYISDDLDLIGLHYLHETGNKWVADLYATYLEHLIPQETLKMTDKTLADLITKN